MPTSPPSRLIDDLGALRLALSPARSRQLILVVALMLLAGLAEVAAIGAVLPFLSLLAGGEAAERLPVLGALFEQVGGTSRQAQTIAAAALFSLAALIAGALRLQLLWSSQRFVFGFGHEIGVEAQRRLLDQPYSFHVARNSSQLVASIERVYGVVLNIVLPLAQAIAAVVIAMFVIAALVAIDPLAAAVAAIAFALIYLGVSALTRSRLARNSGAIGHAYEQRMKIVQESLGGIRDVIIDNSQPLYLESFRRADLALNRANASNGFIASAPRFAIEAAGMVLIALVAMVIAGRGGGIGAALPVLGALALGAQRLLPLVQQVYVSWSAISGNRSSLSRVAELLRLPVAEPSAPAAEPLVLERAIRLDKVRFTYPRRRGAAVEDISLTIPRGSSLALIGRTGGGKSTLVDLLMGLIEPDSGTINVDSTLLDEVGRRRWRGSIAHVPQSIFLADASIAANIAQSVDPGAIDRDRLIRAARDAQLDEEIADMPDGFETLVGERGIRLSGGQRQRLGIARALYKDAPVLVLDEATSSLDEATELAVLDRLMDGGGQRTVVMITHRPSAARRCAQVGRIEDGRLVALGPPGTLLGGGGSLQRASD